MASNTIVMELNQETMTAVEVANRNNNGAEIVRFAFRNLPPDGINATWLKAVWHQEHFSHHHVTYALRSSLVKYKILVMPALPPAQLEEAVKLEISGATDGYQGFQDGISKIVACQKQDQMYEVTVALVAKELLDQELLLLKQAGLEVDWLGLRYQGLENFINFNYGFFEETSEGAAYLDFDTDKAEFGILKNETIVYRRELSLGSRDLLADEGLESLPDLLEEVRLSIAAYHADTKNTVPSRLGVFGKTDAASIIGRAFAAELGLTLYVPEKTNLTGVITHKYTPALAPLIGLALDKTGISNREALRIYTPEQENAKAKRERLIIGAGAALAAAFLFTGIFLGMHADFARETQTGKWLHNKETVLAKLRRTQLETARNTAKINQIENWLSLQNRELEFLLLLKKNLPMGTRITDLTIEDGIVKDLSGVTPSASLLLSKIRTTPGLKDLKIKGTISSSLEGEIFQLEGLVGGGKPAK